MLVLRFHFLLTKSFLLDLMCDILLLYSPKYNSTTEERRQNEHSKHIHTGISRSEMVSAFSGFLLSEKDKPLNRNLIMSSGFH